MSFLKLFGLLILLLLYSFVFNPSAFALSTVTDSIIKPIRINPDPKDPNSNFGKPDVYDKDDRFNPFNINEGDTKVVDVYFALDENPATKELFLCFKFNTKDCIDDPDKIMAKVNNDAIEYSTATGDPDADVRGKISALQNMPQGWSPNWIVRTRVCGTGSEDLNAFDKCDNPPSTTIANQKFKGGVTHKVTLFERISAGKTKQINKIAEAAFYVNHHYPNVFLQVQSKPLLVATNVIIESILPKPTPNPDPAAKDIDPNGNIIFPFPAPPTAIETRLSGIKKPGGSDENDYRVVMRGTNAKYEKDKCVIIDTDAVNYDTAGNTSIPFKDIRQGEYVIDVQEQVNESAGIARSAGRGAISIIGGIPKFFFSGKTSGAGGLASAILPECDSGFTSWRIHLSVEPNRASTTGSDKFIVKVRDIEKDPNREDLLLRAKGVFPSPPPPCSDFDPVTRVCNKIPSALVSFSTKPVEFIKDLFQIVLGFAGFIAFILLLVSGYTLMTSSGDKQKLAGARDTITSAIIGLLFIIFSLVLLEVIGVNLLKIPGFQ